MHGSTISAGGGWFRTGGDGPSSSGTGEETRHVDGRSSPYENGSAAPWFTQAMISSRERPNRKGRRGCDRGVTGVGDVGIDSDDMDRVSGGVSSSGTAARSHTSPSSRLVHIGMGASTDHVCGGDRSSTGGGGGRRQAVLLTRLMCCDKRAHGGSWSESSSGDGGGGRRHTSLCSRLMRSSKGTSGMYGRPCSLRPGIICLSAASFLKTSAIILVVCSVRAMAPPPPR